MVAKKRFFAFILALIMIFAMAICANAQGSSDSTGAYSYYAGEISGEGWFQGNGTDSRIFNCTTDYLDVYCCGRKAATLSPLGMPGSVLTFNSGTYRYVILYNRAAKRMDIWYSTYNGALIADTSMATVAFAKSSKCELEGDAKNAERLYSLGTSYLSIDANTSDVYANFGLKTAEAFVNINLPGNPVSADKMFKKENNFYWYKLYPAVK